MTPNVNLDFTAKLGWKNYVPKSSVRADLWIKKQVKFFTLRGDIFVIHEFQLVTKHKSVKFCEKIPKKNPIFIFEQMKNNIHIVSTT